MLEKEPENRISSAEVVAQLMTIKKITVKKLIIQRYLIHLLLLTLTITIQSRYLTY